MDHQTDADRLFEERSRLRLTQRKLGWLAGGISEQSISQYETGRIKPSKEIAIRLARALGKPVDKIFVNLFKGHNFLGEPMERVEPLNAQPLTFEEQAVRQWRVDPSKMTAEQCHVIAQRRGENVFRVFPERFDRLGNEIKQSQKMEVL